MSHTPSRIQLSVILRLVGIGLGVYLFFFALQSLAQSFLLFDPLTLQRIFEATSSPLASLFLGMLVTAILQSSSTTTALVVTALASGAISVGSAIGVVIGANIGTTFTSVLVAFGYVGRRGPFCNALSAASSHLIFNLLAALLFFPLEAQFGLLSWASTEISHLVLADQAVQEVAQEGFRLRLPLVGAFVRWLEPGWLAFPLALLLLFVSIRIISRLLLPLSLTRGRSYLEKQVFTNGTTSFSIGLLFTSLVQSSSLTIPLIVNFAALRQLSLGRGFSYIMGANLGTTLTALLAAMVQPQLALVAALAHLLFNLAAIVLFSGVSVLRSFALRLADQVGKLSLKYWMLPLVLAIAIYFLLPFVLLLVTGGSIYDAFTAS